MQKIVIKEIDKLKSLTHKNKMVSEYIIYLDIDNTGHYINAYTEIGEEAKKLRVNQLILTHFIKENNNNVNTNDIIEECSVFNN